jgi:hypothetical protein
MSFLSHEVLNDFFDDILRNHELNDAEHDEMKEALHTIFKQATEQWEADGSPEGYREVTVYFHLNKQRFFFIDVDKNPDKKEMQFNELSEIDRDEYSAHVIKVLN